MLIPQQQGRISNVNDFRESLGVFENFNQEFKRMEKEMKKVRKDMLKELKSFERRLF